MSIYTVEYLKAAHKKSFFHQEEILNGTECGCFNCLARFSPLEINDWTDVNDLRGKIALCPKCGIDTVLGSLSGYPLRDKDFLKEMRKYFCS